MKKIFDTDRRIKLGLWGLGRGLGISGPAKLVNMDVVAGCDFNPELRAKFKEQYPDAVCTADENEFFNLDLDAVLIATFLPDHAKHAIRYLESGRHVMCEVSAFQTPGDGVKLVEAVEKSGKVYMMLETFGFIKDQFYIHDLYEQGFFGEFIYGEFEYLHESRALNYGYNSQLIQPFEPGYAAHPWRSGLNHHHYCTHSLGTAMFITGLRPEAVSAMPCNGVHFPGGLYSDAPVVCPSFVKMSNGGVVRNLMGATTNDYKRGFRMWGTKAGVEHFRDLKIRTGGSGSNGILCDIKSRCKDLGDYVSEWGFGGNNAWAFYFFVRNIFEGIPCPMNIYESCDVTMTGLMAQRSADQNGKLLTVPDFRDPAQREQFRNDFEKPFYFDPQKIFPEGHDPAISGNFNRTMIELYPYEEGGLPLFDNVYDGMKIYDQILNDDAKLKIRDAASRLIREMPALAESCQMAKKIMQAYPDCIAGKSLATIFATHDLELLTDPERVIAEVRAWIEKL